MNKEITKTLKELKEEILRLKGAMYSDFLLIGLRLKHIKDTGLFKEEYKSFQEFIEGIDIPSTTAYQTIRIVEVFNIKTDEDIKRFPLAWCRAQVVLPVLEKVRSEKQKALILEMAKELPFSQLKEEVKTLKEKKEKVVEQATLTLTGTPEEIKKIEKDLELLAKEKNTTTIGVIIEAIEIIKKSLGKNIDKETEKEVEINKKAKIFADMFCEIYEQYRKSKYLFMGAKDMLLCKKLVKTFELEDLGYLLEKFFTAKKRWWGDRFTIGVFFSSVNELSAGEDKYRKALKKEKEE